MAQAINWKSDPVPADIELYRNNRLEYLEANLPNYELNTLIELENECFDRSETKDEYENHLQTFIQMLKDSPKETKREESVTPAPIITFPIAQPSAQVKPSISPNINNENNNQDVKDKYKKEIESARLIQQIQYDETIRKYFNNDLTNNNSNKNNIKETEKRKKDPSPSLSTNTSSSANTKTSNYSFKSSSTSKNESMKSKQHESKNNNNNNNSITRAIQRLIPNTNHSSNTNSNSRIYTLFDYKPEKTLCEWRRG